jgi:hypothetical protein
VLRDFVVLCRELDLFGRALIAIDGTRIKAVNSRERNFTKAKLAEALAESDERLARYLKQLDDADKDGEDAPEGGTVERLQEKIAAIGANASKAMAKPSRTVAKTRFRSPIRTHARCTPAAASGSATTSRLRWTPGTS